MADPEFTRKFRLQLAGTGAAAQLDNLVGCQRFLAATVCATLLGQRDPFPLPLTNQRPLEL